MQVYKGPTEMIHALSTDRVPPPKHAPTPQWLTTLGFSIGHHPRISPRLSVTLYSVACTAARVFAISAPLCGAPFELYQRPHAPYLERVYSVPPLARGFSERLVHGFRLGIEVGDASIAPPKLYTARRCRQKSPGALQNQHDKRSLPPEIPPEGCEAHFRYVHSTVLDHDTRCQDTC